MLGFAHRRYATTALFVFSFVESSFFPIPPDVLLGPMCLGDRRRAWRFATVATVASVLGAFLGYALGHAAIDLALRIPGIELGDAETRYTIRWLEARFESEGTWYVFVAALTPIPFKLLTIASGFAQMSLLPFAIACAVGRAARFYGVAAVFRWMGPRAVPFVDRWFDALCVAFAVLLVGGFVAVKWLQP